MENIIGGSCFARLHPKSPPEIQARALLCWVTQALPFGLLSTSTQALPFGLLSTSAPLPSVNNAKRRLLFPLTVPLKHTSPPFYRLSYSSPLCCFSSSIQRLFIVGEFEAVKENCFLLQH